jgi:hypothetical protein
VCLLFVSVIRLLRNKKMSTFNLVLEFQNVKKQTLLTDFSEDLHSFATLPDGGYRVTLTGESAVKWASIFNECLCHLKHFSDDGRLLLDTRSKLWSSCLKAFMPLSG